MKKFFITIKNIFAIEELRTRILNTIGILLIFRLGSFIVVPGVDPAALVAASENQSGMLNLLNTFLGGSFNRASVFALGIMPYISASIVIQLLTFAVPSFQKMQKEGESGRKKITQITRYLTIVVTLFQSIGYINGVIPNEALMLGVYGGSAVMFQACTIIIIISGTMFCMWLGEKITDKGIGNGISMLIMIGIISRFPGAILVEMGAKGLPDAITFILEVLALFAVVMGVVMLTQATRNIPVSYAKQMVGNKVYGGQRQYIPIKLNSSGVMPIIFAQALMFLPPLIAKPFPDKDWALQIASAFQDPFSWPYNVLFGILILIFTFFYTAISVNPNNIADDLRRNNGFVPGIKPGKATSEFIDEVLTRITLPGSIFLALVAVLPAFAFNANVTAEFAQFYGGTSLLIMVGVILDTLQQINSYLLMRHYEGMMKSGKVKGRSQVVAA